MSRHGCAPVASSIILCLICSFAIRPAYAGADSRDGDKPVRLHSTSTVGPIGRVVENSIAKKTVAINGHLARGEQMVWNGDVVEAITDLAVRISLDSVGQITLSGGKVGLSITATRLDANAYGHVLIVSLASGDLQVSLQQDASAYIESCGAAFTASFGASFRLEAREGQPVIKAFRGAVYNKVFQRADVYASAVKQPLTAQQIQVRETSIEARRGRRRRIRVQTTQIIHSDGRRLLGVLYTPGTEPTGAQTSQNETIAADRVLHFRVEPPIGRIEPADITTDASGLATVYFTGENTGSATIIAEIDKVKDYEVIHRLELPTRVLNPTIWQRYRVLIAAAALAGVLIVIVVPPGEESPPLMQQPPPRSP